MVDLNGSPSAMPTEALGARAGNVLHEDPMLIQGTCTTNLRKT